jgi:N-acylneuraminate cytidylyltransferase/CMP-N,N'-diacetyllegionaminic acid synthase
MYKGKEILAVIPARKGSKRLKNKNILPLNNKPLIAWTIEAAINSKYIDKVLVSTDSIEIEKVSKEYKADVPFMRPKHLATDQSDSMSVIKHALDYYSSKYEYIVLLQPTSPLRTTEDIDSAIEVMHDNVKAIISVCEAEHSPLWTNKLPIDLSMKNFIPKNILNIRSQDLQKYYRLNGAIYVAETNYFRENNTFFGENTKAYIMPQEKSIDIDTKLDFELCNLLMNEKY